MCKRFEVEPCRFTLFYTKLETPKRQKQRLHPLVQWWQTLQGRTLVMVWGD